MTEPEHKPEPEPEREPERDEHEPERESQHEPHEPKPERESQPAQAIEHSPGEPGDPEAIGAAPDAVFNALWKRVLEAWDDDKPHQAALSYALDKQMLPEIAGRYRQLVDDPAKGPRAKRKIDGIVVAATQLLLATKSPTREKVPWQWTASVAAVFVLVVVFLAYKLFHR